MQARGVVTLPKKIRAEAGLDIGSLVDVEVRDGEVTMRAVSRLDPDLAADLKSALNDLKTGNYVEFSTIEQFHEKRKAKWKRGA